MTWVDLVVLAVLLLSGLLAFFRGFVREVLGLAAWLGAAWVATTEFAAAQPAFRSWIENPDLADPVAFAVLFLGSLLFFSLIAILAARVVRKSVLSGSDRALGLVFGVARGAVLVIAAYIAGGMVMPVERWPEAVLLARSMPLAFQGASWAVDQVPPDYRPRLYAPPSARDTSAQALMHATPQGYALSAPKP